MFPADENGAGRYIHIKRFLEKFEDEIDTTSNEYKELLKELEAEVIFDETELLRKMYVAVTRAKEILFVVTVADSNGKSSDTAKRVFERAPILEHGLVINIDRQLLERIESELGEKEQSLVQEQVVIDENLVKKQIDDYSSLAYKRYISPTLLYNIFDEKSDMESLSEIVEEFTEEFQKFRTFTSMGSDGLGKLLEVSPEVLEGKQIHRKLMSVNEYNQLEYLVQTGQLPYGILKAEVLIKLFESEKIFSEWRLAKHFQIGERRYVLFGVPDKVFFKDGKIYVVDFKSMYLKEGSPELEKYKFQMQFYMYLLKDFGQVECGYIISTKTGWVIKVEKPDNEFEQEIIKRIKMFESFEVSNI